jgi:hypothetical protein
MKIGKIQEKALDKLFWWKSLLSITSLDTWFFSMIERVNDLNDHYVDNSFFPIFISMH